MKNKPSRTIASNKVKSSADMNGSGIDAATGNDMRLVMPQPKPIEVVIEALAKHGDRLVKYSKHPNLTIPNAEKLKAQAEELVVKAQKVVDVLTKRLALTPKESTEK